MAATTTHDHVTRAPGATAPAWLPPVARWCAAALAAGLVIVAISRSPLSGRGATLATITVLAVAAAVSAFGLARAAKRATQARLRRALWTLAAGTTAWALGEVFLFAASTIGDLGRVSLFAGSMVGDFLFLAFYACAFAAILRAAFSRTQRLSRLGTLVDGGLIAISLFMLAWPLYVDALVTSAPDVTASRIAVTFVAMQIALPSIAIVSAVRTRSGERGFFVMLAIAFALLGVGSVGYATTVLATGTYAGGHAFDASWAMALLVLPAAAAAASPKAAVLRPAGAVEQLLPFVAVIIGVAGIALVPRGDSDGHLIAGWGFVALVTLAMGRQLLFWREHKRLFDEATGAKDERAKAIGMAARSERLAELGTLVAGVAHEINNPLTYVYGNVDEIKNLADDLERAAPDARTNARTAAQLRACAEVATDGLDRIRVITRDLRLVAKPATGARTTVDIHEIVQRILVVAKHRLGDDTLIHLELDASARPVVDAAQVGQVLLNLVLNGADAVRGRPSPQIAIRTRDEGGMTIVEVTDNGPGIPAEARARVFTPFFTTKAEGTGLGLSVSRAIARAHGGDLTFTTSDAGTTMRLALPHAITIEVSP